MILDKKLNRSKAVIQSSSEFKNVCCFFRTLQNEGKIHTYNLNKIKKKIKELDTDNITNLQK